MVGLLWPICVSFSDGIFIFYWIWEIRYWSYNEVVLGTWKFMVTSSWCQCLERFLYFTVFLGFDISFNICYCHRISYPWGAQFEGRIPIFSFKDQVWLSFPFQIHYISILVCLPNLNFLDLLRVEDQHKGGPSSRLLSSLNTGQTKYMIN